MPFYYDINRAFTMNGSAGNETVHVVGQTAANQETMAIKAIYAAGRYATAGGSAIRVKYNTGTAISGGGAGTINKRNLRGPTAGSASLWTIDSSGITAGGTLTTRLTVGFASTGGMGGWVPVESSDALQMMPNATNPVDVEFSSIGSVANVTGDLTVEFSEGI